MKTAKILLRIAATLMLLHTVGHTLGVLTFQYPDSKWHYPQNSIIPNEVLKIKQEVQFTYLEKENSTMAELFSGNGYFGSILLFLITILLWYLSNLKDKSTIKILWIMLLALILSSIVEIVFFPLAAIFCMVSAVLVFTAIILYKKISYS